MFRKKEKIAKTTLPIEDSVVDALLVMVETLGFVEPVAHGENGECIGMNREGRFVGFDIHDPEENFPQHVDGGELKDQSGNSPRWSKAKGYRIPYIT